MSLPKQASPTRPRPRGLEAFAIPAVCLLILFLGYFSQYLLNTAGSLDPGPLPRSQAIVFNVLLCCVWWSYFKACTVDPGRYVFPAVFLSSAAAAAATDFPDDSKSTATSTGISAVTSRSPHSPPPPLPLSLSAPSPAAAPPIFPHLLALLPPGTRWCQKCRLPKPPRAHHCRHCGRCVPRMDHHCPWIGACVSVQTFPHFLRLIVFTNLSLWYLLNPLVWPRLRAVWDARLQPAYLGPSALALGALAILLLVWFVAAFALAVLLLQTTRHWVLNRTLIEDWEMERHEAVLARRRGDDDDDDDDGEDGDGEDDGNRAVGGGGGARGKDGRRRRLRRRQRQRQSFWGVDGGAGTFSAALEPVEFPYDVGFFANMAQAMGTRNVLLWFFPLSGNPVVARPNPDIGLSPPSSCPAVVPASSQQQQRITGVGWEYEDNGLNDRPGMWPPPDPDKIRRQQAGGWPAASASTSASAGSGLGGYGDDSLTPEQARAAFERRQAEDLLRRRRTRQQQQQQRQAHGQGEEKDILDELEEVPGNYNNSGRIGKGGATWGRGGGGGGRWANSEGETLWDYGVDEDGGEEDGEGSGVLVGGGDDDDDDDDVPLAELIRRRKVQGMGKQS